jgi:type II secretory pathway pseudopilin PulG
MTAAASLTASGRRARRAGRPRDGGFTYLSLIVLVAIIGLVTATSLKLGAVLQRARAEQELLRIGAEFSDALQSYADATPAGKPSQPATLKDLLRDPRFPTTRRHLRKIYLDPMTGKAEWGIVYLANKVGVIGIYSLSDARPVKIGNFPARFSGFDSKEHISDWKFAVTGKVTTAGAPPPGSNAAPVVSPPPPATPAAPATPVGPPPKAHTLPSAEPAPPSAPLEEAPANPEPEAAPVPPPAEAKPVEN